MPLILEGLVTTRNADGTVNVSPMGPEAESSIRSLVLKPFDTSTTCQNLKRTRRGVFHVTDDVEMLARAAIGLLDPQPEFLTVAGIDGAILAASCRWYAFDVRSFDESTARRRIECDVVRTGTLREFFGFNRAKHAVLEAAILATRIEILPIATILAEFDRMAEIVQKTGGDAEHRAWIFLDQYVRQRCASVGGEPRG